MADATSQERNFALPPKKGVAGVPCATKSQDSSLHDILGVVALL